MENTYREKTIPVVMPVSGIITLPMKDEGCYLLTMTDLEDKWGDTLNNNPQSTMEHNPNIIPHECRNLTLHISYPRQVELEGAYRNIALISLIQQCIENETKLLIKHDPYGEAMVQGVLTTAGLVELIRRENVRKPYTPVKQEHIIYLLEGSGNGQKSIFREPLTGEIDRDYIEDVIKGKLIDKKSITVVMNLPKKMTYTQNRARIYAMIKIVNQCIIENIDLEIVHVYADGRQYRQELSTTYVTPEIDRHEEWKRLKGMAEIINEPREDREVAPPRKKKDFPLREDFLEYCLEGEAEIGGETSKNERLKLHYLFPTRLRPETSHAFMKDTIENALCKATVLHLYMNPVDKSREANNEKRTIALLTVINQCIANQTDLTVFHYNPELDEYIRHDIDTSPVKYNVYGVEAISSGLNF